MPKKVKIAWVLCCIAVVIGFVYTTIKTQIKDNKVREKQKVELTQKRNLEKQEKAKLQFEIEKKNSRIRELVALGKLDEAEALAKEVISLDPNNAVAHTWWGIALVKAGKKEAALGQFVKSSQLDPNQTKTYIYWGLTLDMQGKHQAAIDKYENALLLDPESSNAYAYWGASLGKLGKYDEAISKLEEALEFNPLNESAYGVLVDTHFHKGDYAKAWEVVARARKSKLTIPENSLQRLTAAFPEPQ